MKCPECKADISKAVFDMFSLLTSAEMRHKAHLRAASLTPERRVEIARKAVAARKRARKG